jgi:primase-polymerase (primpol)-like protein
MFSIDDPITGIDFDHCVDPVTGAVDVNVLDYIRRLDSYTEFSPSGKGLHVFVRGIVPDGRNFRTLGVEVYNRGRYLTLTGHHLTETPTTVESRHAELTALYNAWDAGDRLDEPAMRGPQELVIHDWPDDIAMDKVRQSQHGTKLLKLFNEGDWTGLNYPSQSEADLALVNMLLDVAGGDVELVDRLFRRSRLMREKWDEQHGGQTYGERTIRQALASPPPQRNASIVVNPLDQAPGNDVETLRAQVAALRQENELLRQRAHLVAEVHRNPHLTGNEKVVGIQLANEVHSAESRQVANRRVHLPALGEAAGVTDRVAGRVLKRLAEPDGPFRKSVIHERGEVIDKETGAVSYQPRRYVEVKPAHQRLEETLWALAAYAPPGKSQWGGRRQLRCPTHPDAAVRLELVVRCSVCELVLDPTGRVDSHDDDEP